MKIVLDFDDTIFNTHQMMGEFVKISEKAGFTEDEFWIAYQKCKGKVGDFDIEIITDLLFESFKGKSSFSKKEEVRKEINLVLSRADKLVYPDLFNFIKSFDKKDLILLSYGTTKFHRAKIKNSGVADFFDEIIITEGNKSENLKAIKSPNIFFIDDKVNQIDQVKTTLPHITAIRIIRSQEGQKDEELKLADYVVKDLDEVKKIIFNINKLN